MLTQTAPPLPVWTGLSVPPPPSPAMPGLRARLWLPAAALGLDDAMPRLWLHLDDGRLIVLALRGLGEHAAAGDDALLPPLVAAAMADLRGSRLVLEPAPGIQAHLLWAAPVAPLPMPDGDPALPLQPAVQAWLAALDGQVLHWLTQAGSPGQFWATVRNYNRLVTLPQPARWHRLQALARFPALVAPLLLTPRRGPVLVPGNRHAWRHPAPDVELAIDAGRDLTGALARHWRIGRALVRSPLPDACFTLVHSERRRLLQLLDALPAHRRPADAASLRRWLPQMDAVHRLLHGAPAGDANAQRAVWSGAFRDGWDATWQRCLAIATGDEPDADARRLGQALHDARDYLAALAAEASARLQRDPPVETGELGRLWLRHRGLAGLLADSRRWHEAPQPQAPAPGDDLRWPELIGSWCSDGGQGHARELLSAAELQAEGREMQHCVGGYAYQCLGGDRIFALHGDRGERATAQYAPIAGDEQRRYRLVQLRSHRNAPASAAMQRLAQALAGAINAEDRRAARLRAAQTAHRSVLLSLQPRPRPPLDAASRERLQRWLHDLRTPPRPDLPWHGWVAGLPYHDGPRCLNRIETGDRLHLVREAGNPHDGQAVRVDWQGHKLGYVPRPDNAGIARLLDAGQPLAARVDWVGDAGVAFIISDPGGAGHAR